MCKSGYFWAEGLRAERKTDVLYFFMFKKIILQYYFCYFIIRFLDLNKKFFPTTKSQLVEETESGQFFLIILAACAS